MKKLHKELAIVGICLIVTVGIIILVKNLLVPALGGGSHREVILYLEVAVAFVILS